MSDYRRLAVTLIVYAVVGLALAGVCASFVWQLPEQMFGSLTYWTYLVATTALGLIAAFFGALAYGVSYRLVPSPEHFDGSFRVIKRIQGLSDKNGSRQVLSIVVARGGLWILPSAMS